MMIMPRSRIITKREFLKYSILGGCGLCLGGLAGRLFGQETLELADFADRSFGKDGASFLANHSAFPQDTPWKWATESLYFIETPKGIKCKLCPQKCEIEIGKEGKCHSNVNINGKLWNISYGNPCAVHVDPIEKKPLFHYLPGTEAYSIATAGCNLACLNCQNWEISQSSPKDTRNYDLMPEAVVSEARQAGCKSIAYTYSDPVAFYEYTLDTSILARQKGIRNVIVSAGYINPDPLRRLCKSIDAAQIDIKSFSDETYEMLNGGTLQPVLDTLKILREEGIWLEISNLVVPTWTDDLGMIKEMCEWMVENGLNSNPLHFLRFQPLYKLTHLPPTPVSTLDKARQIAMEAGMKYVYIGNVPGSDAVNTYCPKCKKMLIERQGFSLLQNNISDSKCKFCQEKIDGVWG
jgi:pyruvate formate lyase activating enzyme